MSEWRVYWRSLGAFVALATLFVLWQGLRARLRRRFFQYTGRERRYDMGFFAKLKADVESVYGKIRGQVEKYLPEAEQEIKTETLAVVEKLIAYVEAAIPETETVVNAALSKLVPGLGLAAAAIEAAVVPKAEAEVEQKIDPENPHAP